MPKKTRGLPVPLADAARRFDTWRDERTTRRIPEELWALAARLGARFGLSLTARSLRVDYYALKKRTDAAAPPEESETEPAPAFVEIVAEPSPAPPECRVVFEVAGGAKMRIEARGSSRLDLVELSRLVLEQRS